MTTFSSNISGSLSIKGQNSEKSIPAARKENILSPAQVWTELKAGNELAFETMYRLYADELYRYGMSLFPHRDTVLDAIQDLFLSLWSSRKNLGPVQSVKAYLFTSLRRRVIAKSRDSRKLLLMDVKEPVFADRERDAVEQQQIDQEIYEGNVVELNKAIAGLSDKQREIIYLRFYSTLSYEEIAKIMVLDRKAAYNLMARTLARLKQLMGGIILLLLGL